jgi:iron-sulfur cluster assembly protein
MTDSIITLTDAATDHIKKMLEKNTSGVGFRLSIKKTGCSGYAYVPDIVELVKEDDIHFVQNDLDVYVDPASESFVVGLIIDYVADDAIGLKQKRLVFINPNEKNRCGCGESFTIE